jgi:hypothetical protein
MKPGMMAMETYEVPILKPEMKFYAIQEHRSSFHNLKRAVFSSKMIHALDDHHHHTMRKQLFCF